MDDEIDVELVAKCGEFVIACPEQLRLTVVTLLSLQAENRISYDDVVDCLMAYSASILYAYIKEEESAKLLQGFMSKVGKIGDAHAD
jgi:hypothetical protein